MSDRERSGASARRARLTRRAGLLGGASLLAAAIGRPALAQQEPLSPMLAALYERAKPEREVTIWAAGTSNLFWIPEPFQRRFPEIKVNVMGSREAGTRLIAESRAGRDTVDVWSNSLGGSLEVQRRGMFQRQDWASLGIGPEAMLFGGEGAAQHNYIFTPIFVPNRLPEADRPRRWTDLIEPNWTGKMVATTFHLPRMAAYLAMAWGEERAAQWLRTLVDDRRTMITTGQVTETLTSGERLLCPAESTTTTFQLGKSGVEMGYRLMDIVPASQFVLSVLKKSPRPNAARLLIAWMLSPEGKRLNETAAGWPDLRTNPDSPVSREIARMGAKIIFEDMESMEQRANFYRRFSSMVRGTG